MNDVMDDAGEENKKQAQVYRSRRFWNVLILCRVSWVEFVATKKRKKIINKTDSARCAPQRLYLPEQDLDGEPPKSSRKYRWAATSGNIN